MSTTDPHDGERLAATVPGSPVHGVAVGRDSTDADLTPSDRVVGGAQAFDGLAE